MFGSSRSGEYPKKKFSPTLKFFKYGKIVFFVEPGYVELSSMIKCPVIKYFFMLVKVDLIKDKSGKLFLVIGVGKHKIITSTSEIFLKLDVTVKFFL